MPGAITVTNMEALFKVRQQQQHVRFFFLFHTAVPAAFCYPNENKWMNQWPGKCGGERFVLILFFFFLASRSSLSHFIMYLTTLGVVYFSLSFFLYLSMDIMAHFKSLLLPHKNTKKSRWVVFSFSSSFLFIDE